MADIVTSARDSLLNKFGFTHFVGEHRQLFERHLNKNFASSPARTTLDCCNEIGLLTENTLEFVKFALLLNGWGDFVDDVLDREEPANDSTLTFQFVYELRMWTWAQDTFGPQWQRILPFLADGFDAQWDEKRIKCGTWEDYRDICARKSGYTITFSACLPCFIIPEQQHGFLLTDLAMAARLFGVLVQMAQDFKDLKSVLWTFDIDFELAGKDIITQHNLVKKTHIPVCLQNLIILAFANVWNEVLPRLAAA